MVFKFCQTRKDLYSAEFEIFRLLSNNTYSFVGDMHLSGRLGSMEGVLDGHFLSTAIHMQPCNKRVLNTPSAFRPYEILLNTKEFGTVYQTEQKSGWFKKFQFHQLQANGQTFDMYPIGFGEEGAKCPIYCDNRQIAQIEKPCVVHNDLHQYQIIAENEDAGLIAILFCCYMYTLTCYAPGVQAKQSDAKYISVTKEKDLLKKYNPDFATRSIDWQEKQCETVKK